MVKDPRKELGRERAPKQARIQVVDLGRVEEVTAGNSSGQYSDNSGSTSSNRKDKYGGAGER